LNCTDPLPFGPDTAGPFRWKIKSHILKGMEDMSTDETYEGWKNRETWAFNLHWSNDEGLYHMVRDFAADWTRHNDEGQGSDDYDLGKAVIEYVRETLDEFGGEGAKMINDEVGSWWRVDEAETGAAVRESLS